MWGCGAGWMVTRMKTEGSQHPEPSVPAAALSNRQTHHPTDSLGRRREQPHQWDSCASLCPHLLSPLPAYPAPPTSCVTLCLQLWTTFCRPLANSISTREWGAE